MEIKDDSYYDELIKKRIGEAIREFEIEERLDPEVLRKWMQEAEEKKPLRRILNKLHRRRG